MKRVNARHKDFKNTDTDYDSLCYNRQRTIGLILDYRYFKTELLKIQATYSRANATELLDDHRGVEPPDPIPNSEVKSAIADGSVAFAM